MNFVDTNPKYVDPVSAAHGRAHCSEHPVSEHRHGGRFATVQASEPSKAVAVVRQRSMKTVQRQPVRCSLVPSHVPYRQKDLTTNARQFQALLQIVDTDTFQFDRRHHSGFMVDGGRGREATRQVHTSDIIFLVGSISSCRSTVWWVFFPSRTSSEFGVI